MARYYADPATKPKLDPTLYSLDSHEAAFFKQLTGISDEATLKEHILTVQSKAYEVSPLPWLPVAS